MAGGTFTLAFMRHTGKWQDVYIGMSLDECLDIIEQEQMFWP